MGISIHLRIMPNKIESAEWESVYKESLELIKAYPFLDRIVDRKTYGCDWMYVDRAKERVLESEGCPVGWHVFGDADSMQTAESFKLIRDLQYYRKQSSGRGQCDDILISLISEDLDDSEVDDVEVFESKTQGLPYHIPVLAIACLIESRFPGHAIVFGDVSFSQIYKAVEWANSKLKKPIELMDRADNAKLLNRIKRVLHDEIAALKALMELTLQEKNSALGDFARKQFRAEVISAYFTERFKQFDVNMVGFRSSLAAYLNQGYSLEEACDICVLEPHGCRFDPADFIETVLSMEWGTEEDSLDEFVRTSINHPHSEKPETIPSLFGKILLQIAGVQERVKSGLSFSDMVAMLRYKLGHTCDIEALLEKERGIREEKAELWREFQSWNKEESVEHVVSAPTNVITDFDDLLLWEKGDAIHPLLLEALTKLKDYVKTELESDQQQFARFQEMKTNEKIRLLAARNRYFYIHKKAWDDIIQHFDHSRLSNVVLAILSIKAQEVNVNKLCKAVLNNRDLLKTYLL
ncbi:hypothetical protein [Paenibacillus sp. GCM10027626]|uniref:hypothetical protein n=1 Tax=Paenibacillus sp. GCM10027626 TaxID=3273411 RepID=UPI0036362550